MKTTTLQLTNSVNRSRVRLAFLLIPLACACFPLAAQVRATCQEGCLTNNNTVLGEDALLNNTGSFNTATGFEALFNNTTGNSNTADGHEALNRNTTGFDNTATGFDALVNNTTGFQNTVNGFQALLSNTIGDNNTASGTVALMLNTTGNLNTASGYQALLNNTSGSSNTRWALMPASISPREVTISISATLVWRARAIPFASARAEHRPRHLSPEFPG